MRVRDLSAWYQTTPDLAGTRDGAPALNPSVKDMDEMDHLRRLKKWQLWFVVCGMQLIVISVHASSTPLCYIPSPRHYVRSLRAYIADIKSAFIESGDYSPETALTEDNFGAVLSGLINNVGVNGIRVPIIPDYATPASYSDLYRKIYGYARRNGLLIYASPLGYGPVAYTGWSDERYAAWIAAYSAAFKPNFLSPFNEAGFDNVRIRDIMTRLRPKLGAAVFLVGPDKGHVVDSILELASRTSVGPLFDIVSAHSAGGDDTATGQNWSYLVAESPDSRPVWSTENPSYWSVGQSKNLPGIDGAVVSGVKGLVVWRGKPSLVDDAGQATPKACKLAEHMIVGD